MIVAAFLLIFATTIGARRIISNSVAKLDPVKVFETAPIFHNHRRISRIFLPIFIAAPIIGLLTPYSSAINPICISLALLFILLLNGYLYFKLRATSCAPTFIMQFMTGRAVSFIGVLGFSVICWIELGLTSR